MSNSVICPACNAENASGSKFCNNCGTRLPPSDKIICPSCQTPNPTSRYYCDNCGTRLVQEDLPTTTEPSEKDDGGDSKVFSLPSRKPGDTGELDPRAVPDWLRTGRLGNEEEDLENGAVAPDDEPIATGKLPRIEELTSEKKSTADLPDWLVSEYDSEPIIEAPAITTEYYQDLLSEPGHLDLLSTEEASTARETADLPGWLSQTEQPSSGQEPVADEPIRPDEDLSDWLAELGRDAEVDFASEEDDTPSSHASQPASGELDWLSELGPPNTHILSDPDQGNGDETDSSGLAKEPLPDWLAELAPTPTDILAEADDAIDRLADTPAPMDDDTEEWEFDFDPDDTGERSQPGTTGDLPEGEIESEPDWLMDYSVLQTGALPPQAEVDAGIPDDELPAFDETPEWPIEPERPEFESSSGEYDEAAESEDVSTDEISEWLVKLTGAEPADLIPFDGEQLPDWLEEPSQSGLEASSEIDSEVENQVDELMQAGDLQMTAWLSNISGEQRHDDLAATGDENLPDWLQSPVPADDDDALESEAGQESVSTDIPEWLTEPGLAGDESPGDVGAIGTAPQEDSTEEISEWLSKLTGEEPDDLIPMEGEQLPDWLVEPTPSSFDTGEGIDSELEDQVDELMQAGDMQMTAWLSNISGEVPDDDVAAIEGATLPDWLTEPTETDSGLEAPDEAEEEVSGRVDLVDEEIPDWLTEPGPLEDEGLPASASLIDGEPDRIAPVESTQLPDWLRPPAELADEIVRKPVEEELSSWMDEFDSSELEDANSTDESVDDFQLFEERAVEPAAAQAEPAQGEDANAGLIDAWFADLEDQVEASDDDTSEALLDDLFASGETAGESNLDWLTQPLRREEPEPEPESEIPDLVVDEPQAKSIEPKEEWAELPLSDEPDWLTELESLDSDIFGDEDEETPAEEVIEAPELDLEVEDQAADIAEVEAVGEFGMSSEESMADEEPLLDESLADAWFGEEALLEQEGEGTEMPDWFDQLGAPMAKQTEDSTASDDLIPSDELPEWVASLRPTGDSDTSSLLPNALAGEGNLADITAEMSEAELPDWLHSDDASEDDRLDQGETGVIELPGVPAWLKGDDGAAVDGAFAFQDEGAEGTGSEWADILGALPPAVPLVERLARSDVPEWVQALKPRELTGEALPDEEPETVGPLSGMRGVIGVEPIIATTHAAHEVGQFTVTKEQQQQAALLRQLLSHADEKADLVTLHPGHTSSPWVRILLAVLLLATIVFGLLWSDLLRSDPLPLTPELESVDALLKAAAGRPVLVAIEYSPALSGELTPQSRMLLNQFAANASPIITVSQFAAGTAIASELTTGLAGHNLGLIPGEAIGLRRLSHCLANREDCNNVLGRQIEDDIQEMLAEVALVVVLTGERDSLVNWIEQVGAVVDTPLLVGITQSLQPVVAPYRASGQLQGVLSGIGDSIVYQREFQADQASAVIRQRLIAQRLGQMLSAALFIVGGLIYGVSGRPASKSSTSTSKS